MNTSIVYSSTTGNTEELAKAIESQISPSYCGKISDSAKESDLIFVGFWAKAFSCGDDIADFLKSLKNKKVFLFGTAGYDSTEEYYNKITTAVKAHLDASNTVVGEFVCQGKVSAQKQEAIKQMDEAKFNGMKAKLDDAASHPTQNDLDALKSAVAKVI